MKIGVSGSSRRSILLAVVGILAVVLTACTGRGGGQLPPGAGSVGTGPFTGSASIGFSFSCEDKGGINPQPGRLAIELAYADKGTSLIGKAFGIHGIVDTIDPVLESEICSGPNPPDPENELIFLGRYRPTTGSFPKSCPARETSTSPLCRFEVIVRDNDGNLAPSKGDYFSIKLSSVTSTVTECPEGVEPPCFITEFPVGTVLYARAGVLSSGNLTVN